MDYQSSGFLPLLSDLVMETNRHPTTDLRGDDARVMLGALVEVSGPLF